MTSIRPVKCTKCGGGDHIANNSNFHPEIRKMKRKKGKKIRWLIRSFLLNNPKRTAIQVKEWLNDPTNGLRSGVLLQQVTTILGGDKWIYRCGQTIRRGGIHSRVGTWSVKDGYEDWLNSEEWDS